MKTLDSPGAASKRGVDRRVARRRERDKKTKMPQRHLTRCRAALLLLTTTYVLINQSVSRAEFLPQLEIISYPASTGKPPVWEAMKVQRTVGRELPFAHH